MVWCLAMHENDHVGFLVDERLASLRQDFHGIAGRWPHIYPTPRASSQCPPAARQAPRRKVYSLQACRKDTADAGAPVLDVPWYRADRGGDRAAAGARR